MPLTQECSDFEFHNNRITVVEGSQYNTILQIARQGRRELTIWDEYERVRTGDVNLIKAVTTSNIYDGPRWSRRAVARRTISVARIRGEDKETEFLYVGYSGPEAPQAFKQDFARFSAVKYLNVAQLFGYSDSQHGLPALIFYDALIPLNRVLLSNRASSLIVLYFRVQFMLAEIDEGFDGIDADELWIEPRSGTLRRGPPAETSMLWLNQLSDALPTPHLNPLSIQTYNDTDTVIDYLVRIFPIGTTFEQTNVTDQWRWLTTLESWPYLASSLWKSNQRHIIARWTGLTEIPQYVCVGWHSRLPECQVVMEDGSVWLQFTDPTELGNVFSLKYKLFHGSEQLDVENAWPAQAHSIFSQLGIHEDEWIEYSITDCFFLYFYHTEAHTYQEENTDTASNRHASYLFVRPIPRLSDDEKAWRSWAESTYFWSLDPSGQEEMSESTRVSLGLPTLKTEIEFRYTSWNFETYKLMERFQLFKGFDPKTTGYARSLGHPLMQVVGNEDRLQELGELNDDCSTSEDMIVPCPNTARHDSVPSTISNDTPTNGIPDPVNDQAIVGSKTDTTDPVTHSGCYLIPLDLNLASNPMLFPFILVIGLLGFITIYIRV